MAKTRKGHPVKGAIAGLLLGLSVSLFLLIFSLWVVKSLEWYAIVVGAGIIIGILWGLYGPARRRKESAAPAVRQPAAVSATPPAAPPATGPGTGEGPGGDVGEPPVTPPPSS